MRDRGLIVAGLAVFLGLITFPVWYDVSAGKNALPPDIKLPANEKTCVAPTDFMKTSHMSLLIQWRDAAVRENDRTFRAFDGKTYTISLTGTCLKQCHTSKAEFCDRCHSYSGVKTPYCWDCHVDPAVLQATPAQVAAGVASEGAHE
jgi:hypothetical protein